MMLTPRLDYYRLLNVRRDATAEVIHSAYRRLARAYHPDRNALPVSDDETSKFMVLLNEAYSCLKDPSSRQDYDRQLKIAEPLPLQIAVLRASEEILHRSGWRATKVGRRDQIFDSGADRVGVRLLPLLDRSEFEGWLRWSGESLERADIQCSIAMACRVTAVRDIEQLIPVRLSRATVIDLTDSQLFGDPLPGRVRRELFEAFLID
jgi:curved DNA-binding protein CbpA